MAGGAPLLLNFEQAGLPLARQDELIPAGAYSEQMLADLRSMGYPFRQIDTQRARTLRGTVAAVRLGLSGVREAAETPEVMAFTETQ